MVNEGTGAMRAYQAMLYGEESSDAKTKETWKHLLLQYCELDTMAMVIIFEHWLRQRRGKAPRSQKAVKAYGSGHFTGENANAHLQNN